MTEPRGRKVGEAELPDDLDQNPGIGQSPGLFARAGSKEAELIAGDNTTEGDVENDEVIEKDGANTDLGRTND